MILFAVFAARRSYDGRNEALQRRRTTTPALEWLSIFKRTILGICVLSSSPRTQRTRTTLLFMQEALGYVQKLRRKTVEFM